MRILVHLEKSMKDRSIKYIASLFLLVSACYASPLAAQEGGFMFHEGGGDSHQEKPEAPSSPGTENSFTRPGMKTNYPKDKKKTTTQDTEQTEEENTTERPSADQKSSNKQQPAANPVMDNSNEEEDPDSVLSFNFLHYIIQRFKFSEVIDQ